jgi:hypothetical protein
MSKDDYEVRYGKYGAYHYSNLSKRELTLDETAFLLNYTEDVAKIKERAIRENKIMREALERIKIRASFMGVNTKIEQLAQEALEGNIE